MVQYKSKWMLKIKSCFKHIWELELTIEARQWSNTEYGQ